MRKKIIIIILTSQYTTILYVSLVSFSKTSYNYFMDENNVVVKPGEYYIWNDRHIFIVTRVDLYNKFEYEYLTKTLGEIDIKGIRRYTMYPAYLNQLIRNGHIRKLSLLEIAIFNLSRNTDV